MWFYEKKNDLKSIIALSSMSLKRYSQRTSTVDSDINEMEQVLNTKTLNRIRNERFSMNLEKSDRIYDMN